MLVVTATREVGDARSEAAALAVAAARTPGLETTGAALLLDLERSARWRDTLLAADAARTLAQGVRRSGLADVAVRGRIAAASPKAEVGDPLDLLAATDDCGQPRVVHLGADQLGSLLAQRPAGEVGVLLRCRRERDAALASAFAIELRRRRVPVKVWGVGLGALSDRRARAGLDPGGAAKARCRRTALALAGDHRRPAERASPSLKGHIAFGSETGQAIPGVLGLLAVFIVLALALASLGGAATAKGRAQRAVDLAALSGARSMRDDFSRVFAPAQRPDGTPNPAHLSRTEYLGRARAGALEAAERNGLDPGSLRVSFGDAAAIAPLGIRVRARPRLAIDGEPTRERTEVAAEAVAAPATPVPAGAPAVATGGGYSGPLAYRQGKPMRPDVAAAFDQLARAAAGSGHGLTINSAFRSDAEQAALFAANPDPRWVAPPGRSLHRCGTELDLGPPAAYGWLAANAARFGFLQRYSWEAWHYGFTAGPAPCSAARGGAQEPGGASEAADGQAAGARGLPGFVPAFARGPLLAAAARHDVSAALLAAQLMAESNFNPAAVSPVGAQGIAQFMPATAAAYGLSDPFDPAAAIDAQARLMADLLGQFGSVPLALAAYNAGGGAVSGCRCIPPYPETQAYVARILGLLDGADQLPLGDEVILEVRLVK